MIQTLNSNRWTFIIIEKYETRLSFMGWETPTNQWAHWVEVFKEIRSSWNMRFM